MIYFSNLICLFPDFLDNLRETQQRLRLQKGETTPPPPSPPAATTAAATPRTPPPLPPKPTHRQAPTVVWTHHAPRGASTTSIQRLSLRTSTSKSCSNLYGLVEVGYLLRKNSSRLLTSTGESKSTCNFDGRRSKSTQMHGKLFPMCVSRRCVQTDMNLL